MFGCKRPVPIDPSGISHVAQYMHVHITLRVNAALVVQKIAIKRTNPQMNQCGLCMVFVLRAVKEH